MWEFQCSRKIHHVNFCGREKEQDKLLQLGRGGKRGVALVGVGDAGSTKVWQLFKFKALTGEYNFLSIAGDTEAEQKTDVKIKRQRRHGGCGGRGVGTQVEG